MCQLVATFKITMDLINLSIIRQTFANTVFTHKVQEVAAENKSKKSYAIKIINIFLVFLVLVLLVLQALYMSNVIFSYLGMGLTIIEILFLIYQTNFDYEHQVLLHKNSALKFMGLRDNYKNLIADMMSKNISKTNIKLRRDLLQREYQTICEFSPQTGVKEYKEAQKRLNKKGIVEGENFTWSDEEIDRFLPEKLRLKKSK